MAEKQGSGRTTRGFITNPRAFVHWWKYAGQTGKKACFAPLLLKKTASLQPVRLPAGLIVPHRHQLVRTVTNPPIFVQRKVKIVGRSPIPVKLHFAVCSPCGSWRKVGADAGCQTPAPISNSNGLATCLPGRPMAWNESPVGCVMGRYPAASRRRGWRRAVSWWRGRRRIYITTSQKHRQRCGQGEGNGKLLHVDQHHYLQTEIIDNQRGAPLRGNGYWKRSPPTKPRKLYLERTCKTSAPLQACVAGGCYRLRPWPGKGCLESMISPRTYQSRSLSPRRYAHIHCSVSS